MSRSLPPVRAPATDAPSPAWADHHAELLLRLNRLVIISRRHMRQHPECYADELGGELLGLVQEDMTFLLRLRAPAP